MASTSSNEDPHDLSSESSTELEPEFAVGQKVLVYFHQILYKAKILYIRKYVDSPDDHPLWRYYVHYDGWSDKWDEWVTHMRILEGRQRQILRAQAAALRRIPPTSKPRISRLPEERLDDVKNKMNGMWIDRIYEEKEAIDRWVGTPLPNLLFVRMIEDQELSIHAGLILRLPHGCTVDKIVQHFRSYLREKQRSRLVEKLLNRWVDHFDSKVMKYLIDSEQEVFKEVNSDAKANSNPSELYGVEHLVRMLVALPRSLLRYPDIKKDDVIRTLADFFSFIEENEHAFYHTRSEEN